MKINPKLPPLTGPGFSEVNAVAAIFRRTASMPLQMGGLQGGIRQRVLALKKNADGKDRKVIGSALVFSTPHLLRRNSLIDPQLAGVYTALSRVRELNKVASQSKLLTKTDPKITAKTAAAPDSSQIVTRPKKDPLGKVSDAKEKELSSAVSHSLEMTTSSDTRSKEDIDSLISSLDLALRADSDGSDPVVSRFQTLVTDLLGAAQPGRSVLGLSGSVVDQSTSHDFTQYVFGRDPSTLLNISMPATVQPPADFDDFLGRVHRIIGTTVHAYCQGEQDVGAGYFSISFTQYFPNFIDSIFRLFSAHVGTPLYALYRSLIPGYAGSSGDMMNDVLSAFEEWLIHLCFYAPYRWDDIGKSFDDPNLWTNAASEILARFQALFPAHQTTSYLDKGSTAYNFRPYSTGAINFGLRLVYRQVWRPIGNQSGEIVRTIPLGPKQSEKVSFKTVTTRKESRSREETTSVETSQEGSTSIKDSSDVVKEASRNFKWHVDAEAGVNYGVFSGKLSAGASEENASNSKDTKTRINESMSKSASRMRRDTKVLVSTETSTTTETSYTSEITNPNDEIAVTYVYSKLQRQYDVFTELAEVNSVIFVPEHVPPFLEINSTWVRGNAPSLLRVLLDPMYEQDIRQIVQEPDDVNFASVDASKGADHFQKALAEATKGITQLPSYQGEYVPDFIAPAADAAMRELTNERAKAGDAQRRKYRRDSLFDHLRRNVLHYLRAIWSDEDRDQRWLRYSQIQVPTRWVHDGVGSTGGNPPYRDGRFWPDYSIDSMRPLTDVISPAGPIGYAGNYAVFLMQGSPALANMNEALMALRSHYLEFTVEVDPITNVRVRDAVAFDPIAESSDYTISYDSNAKGWTAMLDVPGGSTSVLCEFQNSRLDIDNAVRIWFDGTPPQSISIKVRVRSTEALQDPEVRLNRMIHPLPMTIDEPLQFSKTLLEQMSKYLPDIAIGLDGQYDWGSLTKEIQQQVRMRYHDFLLVRNSTTRLALDTNNLVLDLEVGQTPALETFKRLHRYIDVLKELEERLRRRLENVRRLARVQDGNLADPDIERVTVVGRGADLAGLVDTFDGQDEPAS